MNKALLNLVRFAAPNAEELRLLLSIRDLTFEEQKIIVHTIDKDKNSPYHINNIIKELNKPDECTRSKK